MHVDSFVCFLTRYLKGRKGIILCKEKHQSIIVSSPYHYYDCLILMWICGIARHDYLLVER